MIESRFKFVTVVFVPGLLVAFVSILISCLIDFRATFNSDGGGLFVISLVFATLLMLFMDLYLNATQLRYHDDGIIVRNFFGLMPSKYFQYVEIDGFHTTTMNSKLGTFNYLYLMKEGRKVARVSDFYHSNYSFLLSEAQERLNDLGYIHLGFFSILKDYFSNITK